MTMSSDTDNNGSAIESASKEIVNPGSESEVVKLSHSELVARVLFLEAQLKDQTARLTAFTTTHSRSSSPRRKPKKASKPFDPSRHSHRFIALKFSYLGHKYNGYEHANGTVPAKPTIEEVLWKALRKAKLINPEIAPGADESAEVVWNAKQRAQTYYETGKSTEHDVQTKQRLELNWDGCQYSKCGRTDRGVSAFGQVIGIKVRSSQPVNRFPGESVADGVAGTDSTSKTAETSELEASERLNGQPEFDMIKDEIPYVSILNSILPADIRILAWCPFPPEGFDARFSCSERRYKYFFTNPSFCPTPGPLGLTSVKNANTSIRQGWLDIEKMREAAKKLEGVHDYRNLCKIDASKQMPSCVRRITFTDVAELSEGMSQLINEPELDAHGQAKSHGPPENRPSTQVGDAPKVYTFSVHGTAFLWHQVRCMVAVLFLVGQGHESPDVIDELLDVARNPRRPQYEMADDAPLVLWDCVFANGSKLEDNLQWVYAGDASSPKMVSSKGDGKFGIGGIIDELWTQWQEARLKEAQVGALLGMTLSQGDGSSLLRGGFQDPNHQKRRSQRVFHGAGAPRLVGRYVPIFEKPRNEPLEVQNAKYMASRKGRTSTPKQ